MLAAWLARAVLGGKEQLLLRKRTEGKKEAGLAASVAGGYDSSYVMVYACISYSLIYSFMHFLNKYLLGTY